MRVCGLWWLNSSDSNTDCIAVSHTGGCFWKTNLYKVRGACVAPPWCKTQAVSIVLYCGSDRQSTHVVTCKDHDWFCTPKLEEAERGMSPCGHFGRKGSSLLERGGCLGTASASVDSWVFAIYVMGNVCAFLIVSKPESPGSAGGK